MVDIIIVNWNGGQYLKGCIDSLLNSSYKNYHIHIVDNGSIDNSATESEGLEKVSVYYMKKNLGFGKACNWVLPYLTGEHVLLLNPDTQIKADTLAIAIKYMHSNKECTVYGCSQVGDDGKIFRTCGRFPNLVTFCNEALGLSALFPNIFKNGFLQTDWDHSYSSNVEHVMGSFYLIRKQWIDENGFLDDRYFVYLEDLDMSKRVFDSGGLIYYDRENTIYHKGGGLSSQVKAKRLFYSLHARHEYIKKFFSPVSYFFASLTMLFPGYITRMIEDILVKRNLHEARETTQAYKMLYKYLFITKQFK